VLDLLPRPERTTHCVVAVDAVGKGEERTSSVQAPDAATKTRRRTAKSSNECRKHPWVKPPRAVGSDG
jgi:hypothetical protein